jgi:hypothetical protein
MMICKLIDGRPTDIRPLPGAYKSISTGGRFLPEMADDGWLVYMPSGVQNIKASHWEQAGDCAAEFVDAVWTADELAAQKAASEEAARQAKLATLTPELLQGAAIFRATLRKHFGDGAELNEAVTVAAVEAHFVGKQLAGTITVQELADAFLLSRLFATITAWTGTGSVRDFPWEIVP